MCMVCAQEFASTNYERSRHEVRGLNHYASKFYRGRCEQRASSSGSKTAGSKAVETSRQGVEASNQGMCSGFCIPIVTAVACLTV